MQSNFKRNKIKRCFYGGADVTAPTSIVFKLHTTMGTADGAGFAMSASAWTNYANVTVANNKTNFPDVAVGTPTANANEISFGSASVTGGVVIAIAGWSAWDQSGNLLDYATYAFQVVEGMKTTVPVGAFTFQENAE